MLSEPFDRKIRGFFQLGKNIYLNQSKRSETYIILTESNFAYKHIQHFKANQTEDRKWGWARCLFLLFSSCSLLLLQSLGDSLNVGNDKGCASGRDIPRDILLSLHWLCAGDMLQAHTARSGAAAARLWYEKQIYVNWRISALSRGTFINVVKKKRDNNFFNGCSSFKALFKN